MCACLCVVTANEIIEKIKKTSASRFLPLFLAKCSRNPSISYVIPTYFTRYLFNESTLVQLSLRFRW